MSEFDTTFSLIDKYQKCKCYKLWLESVLSTDSLSSKIEMFVDTNLPDLGCVCKYVKGTITLITIKAFSSWWNNAFMFGGVKYNGENKHKAACL